MKKSKYIVLWNKGTRKQKCHSYEEASALLTALSQQEAEGTVTDFRLIIR